MPRETFVALTDPVDGTRWVVDKGFLDSNWECIWGRGCQGILDEPAEELNQGCCSEGAQMVDGDEKSLIGTLALSLNPDLFQHHTEAMSNGVFVTKPGADLPNTRLVEGACIFFNQPGFDGGVGCALHIAADSEGDSAKDWKPSICWQAPIKVDQNPDGSKTLRRWSQADWGPEAKLAWCCTDANAGSGSDSGPSAYTGSVPVAESMHEELAGMLGPELAAELRSQARRT